MNMADAKKCLLNAAAKLFSRHGLEKTSTRDLAKESNSNISLISYHFGGKVGLYKEVIREFALEIQKDVTEMFAEYENKALTKELFVEQVSMIVEHFILMRRNNPEICLMLAREKLEGLPLSKDVHEEIFFPLGQKFISLIVRAQKKNIVRNDIHPPLFFMLLIEGLFGFFEALNCETSLRNEYANFEDDTNLLKEQILRIYLQGALV
jgi:AcrR family transcriptional regulator